MYLKARSHQPTRLISTKLFGWVELNRVVNQFFGVNTLTTLSNWCTTDLVSFSSSRRILKISESVGSSRAQLRRVFWCERARDCDRLVFSSSVLAGHDWSRLHATVIGSRLLVWSCLRSDSTQLAKNSNVQNLKDWWKLVVSSRKRVHTERRDATKQFSRVASFGVNAATIRLISTKQFWWVGSFGVNTSTTRLNQTV